ncbi:hypothetical protein N2152v2_008467 [Parachlorella kessleri]
MTGWYDIASLEKINVEEDVAAIKESQQYVEHLVQQEVRLLDVGSAPRVDEADLEFSLHSAVVAAGIPSERVLVGGFSQGGALALTMLRSQLRVAGILGLSSYLLLSSEKPLVSEGNLRTPVLMCHGDADQVVAYEYGQESAHLLKDAGANLEFRTYKWMGHEARADELQDIKAFLQSQLNQ